MINRKENNFSPATVRLLRESVNNHCSKPDCWKRTLGPSNSLTKKKKNKKISKSGQAAHINGATELAARWEKLPPKYLSSYENGIWLCNIHAKMIDDDEDTYKKELLHEWKLKALERTKLEHGTSPPNPDEPNQIIRSMISGEAGLLKPKPLVQAIQNIHKATSEGFENLDPRFKVISSYDNGITDFSFHAKEEVSLNLKIDTSKNKDFTKMIEESIKHGTDVNLPMSIVQIEGSPLFSDVFGIDDGEFSIKPQPIVARDTLYIINPETKSKEYFEVIDGNIVIGTESYTFTGEGLGGFLKISYRRYKDESSSSFDLSFELSLWDKKDVNLLLSYEKLKSFIEKMNQGWEIVVSSEVKGQVITETKPSKLNGEEKIKRIYALLKYIEQVKKISEIIKQKILFYLEHLPIDDESYDAVFIGVDNLKENIKFYNGVNDEDFSFEIKTSELIKPYLKKLLDSKEPINFNGIEKQSVICFGQEIQLPNKEVQFREYIPRKLITKDDIQGLETIELSFHPTKGSKRIIKLIYGENKNQEVAN